MKTKRLGKPDYSSVEDARRPTTGTRGFADSVDNNDLIILPPKKSSPTDSVDVFAGAAASASKALRRMGNKPLSSRSAPKGNNPGSIATMKFPRTSRSK